MTTEDQPLGDSHAWPVEGPATIFVVLLIPIAGWVIAWELWWWFTG